MEIDLGLFFPASFLYKNAIITKRTPFESPKKCKFLTLTHSIDIFSADANFEFHGDSSNSSKVTANLTYTFNTERCSMLEIYVSKINNFGRVIWSSPPRPVTDPSNWDAVIPG
jgi:hypothetical protein